MEADPTRMCELLVGLGDVELVGIDERGVDAPLVVVIRSRRPRPVCESCGSRVWPPGVAAGFRSQPGGVARWYPLGCVGHVWAVSDRV